MDWDIRRELDNLVLDTNYLVTLRHCCDELLPAWLSRRHPDKLPCRLDKAIKRGSFNWVIKAVFSNNESWAIRFPRKGVSFADAKVEAEVAAITLIQRRTDIPVPEIIDWGLAASNELGLGPFIISRYVEGVSLADLMTNSEAEDKRLFREDFDEDSLLKIFQQIARFTLQLSQIEFPAIGGLSLPRNRQDINLAGLTGPPVSLKAQDILQLGGLDILDNHSTTFLSTKGYFTYLADQDLAHLRRQLNSVDDAEDAEQKYVAWHAIKRLVPRFCQEAYTQGPFKLICDDFGPLNMLVRSSEDLTIVAVLDWEWSYAGPVELFWCPPRWLTGKLPGDWPTFDDSELSKYKASYLRNLEIYIRTIEEAEGVLTKPPDCRAERPSTLLRRIHEDGSMWFYHIIREAYNGPDSEPFRSLRLVVPDFEKLVDLSPQDIRAFVELKQRHLQEYEPLAVEKEKWFKEWKASLDP